MIIAELNRRASELESEAGRLRSAAEVLRGGKPVSTHTTKSRETGSPHISRTVRKSGTMPLILTTLRDAGPLENKELTEELLRQGWKTNSVAPTNTVRTALGRLIERAVVTRLSDGRFALAEES